MFLEYLFGFLGALLGSIAGQALFHRYLVREPLLPEKPGGILRSTMPKVLGRSQARRKPKVYTDLEAYQKEIQEQGENRG